MDGRGLQAIRSEIEAIVTFQSALNRLALFADENSITEWGGPRPEEIDDLARDDGSFFRDEIIELRRRASSALAVRFREVAQVTKDRPALRALLGRLLSTGTGGVVTLTGPEAGNTLAALARTGAIRLDWAEAGAALVREELDTFGPKIGELAPAAPEPPRAPKKRPSVKKKPSPKTKIKAKPKGSTARARVGKEPKGKKKSAQSPKTGALKKGAPKKVKALRKKK
jgi:hypothetical protein